jgi:hypothetical protein
MTDAIWNSMTGEVETPCGSVFMTVDWDYEEKDLTLNNLAHIERTNPE